MGPRKNALGNHGLKSSYSSSSSALRSSIFFFPSFKNIKKVLYLSSHSFLCVHKKNLSHSASSFLNEQIFCPSGILLYNIFYFFIIILPLHFFTHHQPIQPLYICLSIFIATLEGQSSHWIFYKMINCHSFFCLY